MFLGFELDLLDIGIFLLQESN